MAMAERIVLIDFHFQPDAGAVRRVFVPESTAETLYRYAHAAVAGSKFPLEAAVVQGVDPGTRAAADIRNTDTIDPNGGAAADDKLTIPLLSEGNRRKIEEMARKPARIVAEPQPGCICPPTSEQTCLSPTCPRGGARLKEALRR